jgi:hypothetical protein
MSIGMDLLEDLVDGIDYEYTDVQTMPYEYWGCLRTF